MYAARDPNWPILDYISQECHCEVVIGDVACVEEQPAIRAAFLCCGQGDLAVFHHLVHAIDSAYHTNWLCGVRLLHHLPREHMHRHTGEKGVCFSEVPA